MSDLLVELADTTLPPRRIEAIWHEAISLWREALTSRVPGPTGLFCALARHPGLSVEHLQIVLVNRTVVGAAVTSVVDWAVVGLAAEENPSLPLYRLTGEVPGV